MNQQYRHGDLLLERVGEAEVPDRGRARIVLARGEATGHAHVARGVGLALAGDVLDAPEGTELTHEEHTTIHVAPGRYRVRRQTEWVEAERAARPVRD